MGTLAIIFTLAFIMTINIKEMQSSLVENIKEKLNKVKDNISKPSQLTITYESGESLIYPGNNKRILDKINSMWEEYYECLNTKNELKMEHYLVQEDMNFQMECGHCKRPFQENENITWAYTEIGTNLTLNFTSMFDELDGHDNQEVTTDNMTLKMFRVRPEQTGLYACYQGDSSVHSYHLVEVVKQEMWKEVWPDTAVSKQHAQSNETIPDTDLVMYTKYGAWSLCNTCGQVGKRYRHGVCTVDGSHDGDVGEVLGHFKNGVACRSRFLPRLDAVRKRESEIMTSFCKVKCKPVVIFEQRDELGRLLESANNTAGIYSLLQGVPPVPPPVARDSVYQEHGSTAVIRCPGNLKTDTPVKWKLNKLDINPKLIEEETKGRIKINIEQQIVIGNTMNKDAGIYSCWQSGELAGTVKYHVVRENKLKLDHHLVLFGTLLTILTFIIVGVRIFTRRHRIT